MTDINKTRTWAITGCPTPAPADGRPAPPEGMRRDNLPGKPHKRRPPAGNAHRWVKQGYTYEYKVNGEKEKNEKRKMSKMQFNECV